MVQKRHTFKRCKIKHEEQAFSELTSTLFSNEETNQLEAIGKQKNKDVYRKNKDGLFCSATSKGKKCMDKNQTEVLLDYAIVLVYEI